MRTVRIVGRRCYTELMNEGTDLMKKFEVVFNDSNYDYVTRNMILEYLQGAFTKADIKVKTVRKSNGKQERKKSR